MLLPFFCVAGGRPLDCMLQYLKMADVIAKWQMADVIAKWQMEQPLWVGDGNC